MLCFLLSGCGVATEEPADDGQENRAEVLSMWEGEWSCYGMVEAEITIIDVTESSFDFSFFGTFINPYGAIHFGELEGIAYFTADNQAVCDYKDWDDEVTEICFFLDDGELNVSTSNKEFYDFGQGVIMDGVYTKSHN